MGLFNWVDKKWKKATRPRHVKLRLREWRRWTKDNGEQKRYAFASLPAESVVVDLGGYRGEWASGILALQSKINMHVFEAHPGFALALQEKFADQDNVVVHAVGLGSREAEFSISDSGEASSAQDADLTVRCRSVEAGEYFRAAEIGKIDLLKVNIEGGEYDILPHLIKTNLIRNVEILQVQFHRYDASDEKRRDDITQALAVTHTRTWCYDFIWEEWRRKA